MYANYASYSEARGGMSLWGMLIWTCGCGGSDRGDIDLYTYIQSFLWDVVQARTSRYYSPDLIQSGTSRDGSSVASCVCESRRRRFSPGITWCRSSKKQKKSHMFLSFTPHDIRIPGTDTQTVMPPT